MSQLYLHGMKRGNFWMKARKALPVCQMLPTSGYPKSDPFGGLVVKEQMVNPRHPVNQDADRAHMYKLPRLLKDPKGRLTSIILICKDPNQVDIKATKHEPQSSHGGHDRALRPACLGLGPVSVAYWQAVQSVSHFSSLKWNNNGNSLTEQV